MIKKHVQGFFYFIRTQGVVSLAVGFLLGGAVAKVVTALVTDIINPLLGLLLGRVDGLKMASFNVGTAKILYGDFVSVVIDFIVVALVVYFGVKAIGVEKLDKPKS